MQAADSAKREGIVSNDLRTEEKGTPAADRKRWPNSLDSLPKRVHSFVEESSVLIELVREDEVVVESVEASPRESGSGSVFVDQAAEGGYIRYLFQSVCYVRRL